MTKELVLLMIAGALIVLGLFVIVTALRRARRREQARERVDALLDLCAEPATEELLEPEDVIATESWNRPFRDEPVVAPVTPVVPVVPVRVAGGHGYVLTLSDTCGSFGVRPGFDRGQTQV